MKKIFTVLMALGIALCTMANPTFSVAERLDLSKVATPKMEKQFTPVEKTSKAVRADKQEARQAMVEARQAQTVAPMAINGVRQIEAMPVATAQKQALPVVNNKQRAAAQATAATDTVEIVATFWAWEYYASDNDWYTTLVDATETYEFKLDYVSTTQAGTFTEADCIMDYTGLYIHDGEGGRTAVGFTEVDIVVTDDENGLTLHAELLGTDNVLYVVDAHIAPLPEPKGNVELAYVNAELVDATLSSSAFQFSAFENGYYTSIFIYSDQVEGEYDKMDMYDPYYNYIAHIEGTDTTFIDFLDLNAVVTKEGKTYSLVADVLGSDTIMYHITMSYTKPDPTDTIDIVATNLYIDEFEFWGMVFTTATASNDEYEVTFDLSIALAEGEYATEDFNASYCGIVRTADMAEIAMTEISATVTGEGGDRVIKAEVVGSDNVLYNMDLSYVVPEATDTVQVVFDKLATAEYYSSSADYYIVNKNENYIVTLDIFEEKGNLMGEYSAEDFDLYYTQLGVINGDTTVVTIADAKAVVTPVEEGIVLLEAELVGMDAVLYKVSTKVDVADKGLQHDATEGFLMDEYTTEDLYSITDYSNYGFIYFDVEAADGTDLMGLQFWVDGTDENTTIPVGTYPINDSMEPGTVMASEGLTADGLTYSLYATMDAEGKIVPPCWFMVGGEVVVSEENGILSITVDAVNSNNLPIFITCEYDLNTKQGLPYDMTEGSVERTYSDADIVKIDTQYVAQYGQLNFAITAADASDMISMVFFVEEADAEIGIPAGVYTIDDSGDYGTVYASPGVQDNKIYPSFYGQLSATGGIVAPCYFMVGGQVVVENVNGALKVTIDALNSYDVPAHIVYEVAVPEPELPAASVRAWAYDLALAVEGEQYTFSYKATTAALATLILTDAEGVELATKDLGLVEAGANTAVLAASELPAGEKVNWAIKLEAGAIAEFTEVTDASRGIYNFYLPQGVAVDNNPESATFGTIYVAAATDGASDGSSDRADTQKRGIFIYDQELNELNPTSNVGIVPSNVTFGATSRQVMKRLVINPATNEVAFAHNAAPMAVWAVPAENVGGEAKNLIEGLGFTNVNSICFTEDGTLYVLESNGYPAPGSLYKVANGVVDTIFAGYTRFGNGDNALVSDNRGGVWICQNRGQLDTYNQLTHVNAAGEIDFEVNTATPNGFESMNTARGTIAYNPAEDILAMSLGTGSTIGASLYKVTYDEATGVPALTLIGSTPSMGKNVDGLAFDYAGDLYGLSANKERLYKYAVPTENNVCVTPAAAKYAFEIEVAAPVEMVGVVKRTLFNGYDVVVLTHEEDGTAHIYNIVEGEVLEVSQEGVIAVDPENAGDYLAISDIALTEDGKLVACNYMMCQGGDAYVDAGYLRGENRFYIWNDLAGDPSLWFSSKMSSNWYRSMQGYTMALKGTSQNAEIFTTGVHGQNGRTRFSWFHVIDGVYKEPDVNNNDYYHFHNGPDNIHASGASLEALVGTQYELNASPLAADRWIMDGNLVNPYEYVLPATNNVALTEGAALTEDLGKKYNGASYITVDGAVYMVAPYATPDGKLNSVMILDVTNGLDAAQYVNQLFIDEAVEATAAATAVTVVENTLAIALVVDADYYMLECELPSTGGDYDIYEEEITNLMIDLDNLVLIGGPSANLQVDVYLPLGEYNMSEDSYQLTSESSISVYGQDATFIEGYAYEIDAFTPSAKAVVRCEWNGMKLEFHLTMTAAPLEATVVVVENALVEIEKYQIWGDMYDYALTMTGEWVNEADGLTYPVLVEVPVYYPEATEPSEIMSTVTVGGWNDDDPWLGFGEGTLTVTTVDGVVTATGIVQNPMAGVAIDITISGKLPEDPGPGTGLEDVELEVKAVKVIKNGQLIISKDGKEYNAQGAQL